MDFLRGIVPALVTPFDGEGRTDEARLSGLVERLIGHGAHGFFACGSSGEVYMLSEEERMRGLEVVIEAAQKRAFVVAHVGSISTEECIRLAKHAERAGASAIAACTPFYFRFTPKEIMDHFLTLADATELPFAVYNIPMNTSYVMTCEMIAELHRLNPKICAVKNTSYDLLLTERLSTLGMRVFCGQEEVLLASLAAGACGSVGSSFNITAQPFRQLYDAFAQGELSRALTIQRDCNSMIQSLASSGVFASVKAILRKQGVIEGGCKPPFKNPTPEREEQLWRDYQRYIQPYTRAE